MYLHRYKRKICSNQNPCKKYFREISSQPCGNYGTLSIYIFFGCKPASFSINQQLSMTFFSYLLLLPFFISLSISFCLSRSFCCFHVVIFLLFDYLSICFCLPLCLAFCFCLPLCLSFCVCVVLFFVYLCFWADAKRTRS